MIPASFKYLRADSAEAALDALAKIRRRGEAAGWRPLAAPTHEAWVWPDPEVLVDIGRLDELRYVREDGDRTLVPSRRSDSSNSTIPWLPT